MDFTKHLQKAEEALRRRNYDFAVELYRQLLDLDPDQGEARGGLRRALRQRHESKRGGKLLRTLAGAAPLARAKTLARMGKHQACARALEDYLAKNPLDEEANLLLGRSLEEAEAFRSARAVYEFLAEIAPRNPEGLKRAGAMMQRAGDHPKALEYFERALEADPRDREALKMRKNLAAEAALTSGGFETASHSREQIKDKERHRELAREGQSQRGEEDLQLELSGLEDRLAENPSDPDLMARMAEVHERLGDPEAALDLVERALSYRRDSFELQSRRTNLAAKGLKRRIAKASKAGEEDAANQLEAELYGVEVEGLRALVELRPGDGALRLRLGRRLFFGEKPDAALVELQKAVADPRSEPEARFFMARCFQAKGFYDLARREYDRALGGLADDNDRAKEILYNLGSISEAEGDPEAARAFFARIYAVDIGYRDVATKMEGAP